MAAHEPMEYSTAAGNDYAEHEGSYERFVLLTFVGACYVLCVTVALAVGGVNGAWWTMAAIIVVATIIATLGLATGAKKPIAVMLAISLLALALT
jgi:hypothetical protein